MDTARSGAASTNEKTFLKKLTKLYQLFAAWWRLQPGVAGTFHDWMKKYNAKMIEIETLAATLNSSTKADAQAMLDASVLATDVYTLATNMASQSNYGLVPGFKAKIDSVDSMGVISPAGTPSPVFRVVQLLAARSKQRDTLTTDQKALLDRPTTDADLADALNKVP